MSLIHKESLVIQTSNAIRFNDNPASPEPTYKVGGALTGKLHIPSCSSGKVKSVLKCHFGRFLVFIRPKPQNHGNPKPAILSRI